MLNFFKHLSTLSLLLLSTAFFQAGNFPVFADCAKGEQQTDLGCIPTDPLPFAAKVYGIGLGLIGGVALIFIMYGGYLILSSKGDQLALSKGKSYVVSAVIGLLLAVAGYALYQIIAIDVIKLPGFGR